VVTIKNLSKFFGEVRAVNDISLAIEDGVFLTLLGPSGSGKTTTLMMLAGFEYPTSGDITIGGKSIVSIPPFRRNIGMVFQNYALFPHLTVYDNIAFPLKMRKIGKSKIDSMVQNVLDLVELPGMEKRRPSQLSGGQQQRIALARAMVFDPPLLLMDEPLGALDKKLREHMQLEIKNIQEQVGKTIVYVTHDQSEALTMSNKIAVMNEGSIEQIGSPEEVYEKPSNRFVADFIGESNFFEGTVMEKIGDGEAKVRVGADAVWRIANAGKTQIGNKVTIAVRPEKLFFVRKGDHNGEDMNTLKGRVEEVIYIGEIIRYRIGFSNQDSFYLKQQTISHYKTYKRDESVIIGWMKGDGILLR
jgi:spermidine/putrescine ABC transporter ATP-binding subunit